MKTHTNAFKTNLKSLGREITARITYNNTTLTSEDINTITYSYQGDILKSVMKQLDLDTIVDIPLKSEITLEFGVLVNNEYEYINYGSFIVERAEKREDTNSYMLTCYDRMLYAQTQYESLNVVYPITIRNYISALCTKIGLTFQNASSTFPNYDKQIPYELYLDSEGNSLNYTYRDVLDELAQVTASTICINDSGNLELRYINDTEDTIDEEYLKNVNVNFGEQFGAINTIVFSRSAGADKISLSNPVDLADEDKIAIEIADNQILNGLNRGDYLSDILNQLYGLSYYLNDFESTGVCYYDLCDKYNVSIGENTYSCIMLNDEINITQGLKETIYTNAPLTSEQEYDYMTSDDRWKSRTTLIVDKQGQQIQSVVSQIGDRSSKTTTITQDIDTIQSEVQNIPVITTENSGLGVIQLQNLATSKIIGFNVHPTNQDILGVLVSENLICSDDLIIDDREIVFSGPVEKTFELPMLYYYNSEVYDEFVYDAVEEQAYMIQRVQVDNQGNKSILQTPVEIPYEYVDIGLDEGNYTIFVATCPTAYIYAKGMTVNEYTKSFASSYEVDSKITQTANQISAEVSEKVDKSEVISSINIAVQEQQGIVELKGNSVTIESDNFELDRYGNAIFRGGSIYLNNGSKIMGDDGLMSTYIIFSPGHFTPVGYDVLGEDSSHNIYVKKSKITFDFEIPNDFVVQSAYIVLIHAPVHLLDFFNPQQYTTGYSRNLKLYKSLGNIPPYVEIDAMEGYMFIPDTNIEEIPNAFGPEGFTGSTSGGTRQSSFELKSYINNGVNQFIIQTSNANPTTRQDANLQSGACYAMMYITGYMNYEE